MSHKLNQKGFSAIEGLLSVIAVALVIFVGYYVWHTQNQTDAIDNSAAKIAQSSPAKGSTKKISSTPASTQKYFTISEWGVRAPYTGSLTLQYKINTDNTEQYASFNSTQLIAYGADCNDSLSGEGGSGGSIERYKSTDHIYGEDGSDLGTAASYFANYNNSEGDGPSSTNTYKQVGAYYYQFVHTQDDCTGIVSGQNVQAQTEDAVASLVKNLQAIPQ